MLYLLPFIYRNGIFQYYLSFCFVAFMPIMVYYFMFVILYAYQAIVKVAVKPIVFGFTDEGLPHIEIPCPAQSVV